MAGGDCEARGWDCEESGNGKESESGKDCGKGGKAGKDSEARRVGARGDGCGMATWDGELGSWSWAEEFG